jgi:PAS domain S-box-containing protein
MTALLQANAAPCEALLNALLNDEETLLAEFSPDDFTLLRTNPRFRTLYSVSDTDNTLNLNSFQQHPELYKLLSDKQQLAKILSNSQTCTFRPHLFKQRLIAWQVLGLSDAKQGYRSIVLLGQDITRHESDQAKWDTAYCSLESIVTHLPGMVYWMDKDGVNLSCNNNLLEFWGIAREEYEGSTCEELVQKGYLSAAHAEHYLKETMEVAESGKASVNLEDIPVVDKAGKTRRFLTSKVPVYSKQREIIGVAGISIDITERKEMEQALLRAKQLAEQHSRFLANMSHDVKTPLSGIIGLAELLQQRVHGPEHQLAQDVQEAARQLLIFFDNCIELANIENGTHPSMQENFNLRKLIGEIASLFQPTIKTKGLILHIECSDDIPMLLTGNRSNLYRVILNLLGNAIKFTAQGSITVRAKLLSTSPTNQAVVQLSFIDTGIGIPLDKRQTIFERFSRVASTEGKSYEGSGIGLNIVQTFVRDMGGEIAVEGETTKGSHFIVTLPFQVPATASQLVQEKNVTPKPSIAYQLVTEKSVPSALCTPPNDCSKTRILLVEDNPMAQKVATMLLQALNCQVDLAECGQKAIDQFEAGKYNLVFMDIGLPDIKGYSVSKQLRDMEEGTLFRVPILGLSAHATLDEEKLSIEAGMDKVLSKPLLMDDTKVLLDHYVFQNKPVAV